MLGAGAGAAGAVRGVVMRGCGYAIMLAPGRESEGSRDKGALDETGRDRYLRSLGKNLYIQSCIRKLPYSLATVLLLWGTLHV